MNPHLNTKRATLAALLTLSLVFAVAGFTPQGKGQKGGSKGNSDKQLPTTPTQPNDPTEPKAPTISKTKVSKARKTSKTGVSKKLPNGSNGPNTSVGGTRQSCVKSCNASHKNDAQICKGRTGQDRADCQREINDEHRLCVQSCPR
jgi:hypothetical protein